MSGSLQSKMYGRHRHSSAVVKKMGIYNNPVTKQMGVYNNPVKRMGIYTGVAGGSKGSPSEMYPHY